MAARESEGDQAQLWGCNYYKRRETHERKRRKHRRKTRTDDYSGRRMRLSPIGVLTLRRGKGKLR